jgi:hypothetical protein
MFIKQQERLRRLSQNNSNKSPNQPLINEPLEKFRFLNFWISDLFSKTICVLCFSKLKARRSKYQSRAKLPWTHSGKVWTQTKFIWHSFGAVLPRDSPCDTATFVTRQLSVHCPKPLDFHTQTTKLCRGRRSCAAIMAKFAKIFNLWALELGQKQKATCSIACLTGRARTGRGSARPARGRLAPRTRAVPSPINVSKGLSRWNRTPRAPPKPRITGVRREKRAPPPAIPAQARPSWPPPFCWTLASPKPLNRSPVKPWSFSKLAPRHCLTGEAIPPSPDFGLPPPRVDRTNQWVSDQFLALIASLASPGPP